MSSVSNTEPGKKFPSASVADMPATEAKTKKRKALADRPIGGKSSASFQRWWGARPLPVHPASQLLLKPPPGLWIHSPTALSSLFCSRKVSFIRELLLVLFVCFFFLISKNKEFTKMVVGGAGRRKKEKGRAGEAVTPAFPGLALASPWPPECSPLAPPRPGPPF